MGKMTREEAEARILEKLKEIKEIAMAYYPDDDQLSLGICGDDFMFWNSYFYHEGEGVLDKFYSEKFDAKGGEQ